MRTIFLAISIGIAFLAGVGAQPMNIDRDLVPDAATALKVGVAILEAYYGEKFVRERQPYKAVIIDNHWAVIADRPAGQWGGGDPSLELSKKDAQVLNISLSR